MGLRNIINKILIKNHKRMWYLPSAIVSLGLLLLIWRTIQIQIMPYDNIYMPSFEKGEAIEIPQRPGIKGIEITGPLIVPLIFQIDLSQSGVMIPLSWQELQNIDPATDVTVDVEIFADGTKPNVIVTGRGHTIARILIKKSMETWRYKNYKTGHIFFWYNLPSTGKRVEINTKDLKRRSDIPMHKRLINGKLHLIEGIRKEEIKQ